MTQSEPSFENEFEIQSPANDETFTDDKDIFIPSETEKCYKIEKIAKDSDSIIKELQDFKDGKLTYKDYEYEVLKYDELLTKQLCKLDVIQGSPLLMKKRKLRVLKIVEALKTVDELKCNFEK
jgi:hypothetical protein